MIPMFQKLLYNSIFLIRALLRKLKSQTEQIVGHYLIEKSPELKECYRFLNILSRYLGALVQNASSELRTPMCLFYLVLRGLDTIEDDMTIDITEKEPLLRNFHKYISDESWTYNGNGPQEKHRELLVKFNVVLKELKKIKIEYQIIIKDIVEEMGNGMADFAKGAKQGIQTIHDYETYCHVAGGLLVEGVFRMLVEAKIEDPAILKRPKIMAAAGRLIQQANIIHDIREDYEANRYFWPREIWSKYVDTLPEIFLPENKEKALQCLSEMILQALRNARLSILLIKGLRERWVLQLVALPQTMYISKLEVVFQNYAVFERAIEISKNDIRAMVVQMQDFQGVCKIFRKYVRRIRQKNRPHDPHFLNINEVCDEIEKYIESEFPDL